MARLISLLDYTSSHGKAAAWWYQRYLWQQRRHAWRAWRKTESAIRGARDELSTAIETAALLGVTCLWISRRELDLVTHALPLAPGQVIIALVDRAEGATRRILLSRASLDAVCELDSQPTSEADGARACQLLRAQASAVLGSLGARNPSSLIVLDTHTGLWRRYHTATTATTDRTDKMGRSQA